MKLGEWLNTQLPVVAENLYRELLREDSVPEEYRETPVSAAWYHLSRHARNFYVTKAEGSEDKKTEGRLPPTCEQPETTCKAFGLSQALLACQAGSPGMRASFFNRYADAVTMAVPALSKVLKKPRPPKRRVSNASQN
jgi:hypothetical protein